MSRAYKTDVIIIGGGPSGTATAISCANRGLKVTIIEGEVFPRYRPGETLHPGIEPLLKELGVVEKVQNAGFLRHKGHWVKWEGDRAFVPFNSKKNDPWYGFQAWRADFDMILLERAISLGVEIYQPCYALQPIIHNNRVKGVLTSKGEMHASFVVDATGRRQWLAQKLKLTVDKYSPSLIVHFGYAQGKCPIRDLAPAIVAEDGGWTWTARVRSDIYQWTRLSFNKKNLPKGWLPKEFHELTPIERRRGADMTWRAVRNPGGYGYFLVGDAATVLDPASSHGVLKAIMSGMMAGHLISQITMVEQREEDLIGEYCKWVKSWFKHDVEKLKAFYALLPFDNKFS
ncbi:NAD(P)/FAD-dependent oxidoreductase [Priestia megaterium]|uniref:NAD(P)/FAD-dependent oxidoreductase n=1 Tax=Priestia megaterium TaxID=1404 RepID=UPI001C530AD4|nr:FAD-dependent oxidoreductase [Priestia megaterium]MBW0931384.1 tryptophan 7-halogenase [Priestia megaterium]